MKAYTIPSECVTYIIENKGPILRNGQIQRLEIPRKYPVEFYHLKICKISRHEIMLKKKDQKIVYEAEIIPNMRTGADYFWFVNVDWNKIYDQVKSKIKREISGWANKTSPCGSAHKNGSKTYMTRGDKFEVTVKWEVIQY